VREIAIKRICNRLINQYNIRLDNKISLDFFAREGDWQTQHYASLVAKVHAWEIDPRFEQNLRNNLPDNASVCIGDSFELARKKNNYFDMIVVDNPQGCFGENNMYCEHFEAIEVALNLMKADGGLLIFNVKTEPFSYQSKLEWQSRRNKFYSVSDASYLSGDFIINFYKNFFRERGYKTKFIFLEKRPQESGLFALTIKIIRRS
jgi:hypothetical protein